MWNKKYIKNISGWGAIMALLLLSVWGIRKYGIESVHLSTRSMENALHKGDYVLVNKAKWMRKDIQRNAILLFTSPLQRDTAAGALLISRCIAVPGDTVLVHNDGYRINGKEYPLSPNTLRRYSMQKQGLKFFIPAMKKLNIPERERVNHTTESCFTLTSFEAYQVTENLPEMFRPMLQLQPSPSYQLIIPQKGRAYPLDSLSLIACKEAIRNEAGNKALFKEGKLYLDGAPISYFFFKENYYWLLSDNVAEAIDSRHVGLIPESHIIGNLFFCWYSNDPQRRFKKI